MSILDVAITSVLAKRYEKADQDAQNKALALSMFLPGGFGVIAGQAILKEADEEAAEVRPGKSEATPVEAPTSDNSASVEQTKRGETKARLDEIAASAAAAREAATDAQKRSDDLKALLVETNKRLDDVTARLDALSPKVGK